ncbi:uncharacterized protein isoform X1 [Rhodnius prolixus]|uniref:uncharacterized protein isoform X1 n=1 Tax=Rhodnius prolixus TaxID=13249 RepID=UPI003D18D7BF
MTLFQAAGLRGARVGSKHLFHCNTWHSIDFWMGIDSTSVDGNTCKDNWTKEARESQLNLRTVQVVNKEGFYSQDVAPFTLQLIFFICPLILLPIHLSLTEADKRRIKKWKNQLTGISWIQFYISFGS